MRRFRDIRSVLRDIRSPSDETILPLCRFNTFQIEASSTCQFDYVAVYDGPNTLAPLMGRFCGSQLPPDLRSSTNQLFIVFRTDASIHGLGWRATYRETLGRSTSG